MPIASSDVAKGIARYICFQIAGLFSLSSPQLHLHSYVFTAMVDKRAFVTRLFRDIVTAVFFLRLLMLVISVGGAQPVRR